ncbi:recombinase family protein [Noviherbaspirillum cavernae]|uniref:recombinase family protein n=1 Tax=Noviherbaspirillum cavernae TaxID=2320862 RepID=UPI0030F4A692
MIVINIAKIRMENTKVYSYLRFSDPKQAAGSSAERQLKYAEKWATDRGLPLDSALSLRDEGLSAYHQKHVKQGALGTFLAAISDGRIPPGSVLVVEGLDRLSRAEPIQAQAQLAQIINAGITVVTASDGREYNRERLKAQPMDLVYSLLVMIRAHEESDTKSKRVKAAIRRLCEAWIAGTYRGIIRNGRDPHWARWNGKAFELVLERAEAVKVALQLFKTGYGGTRLVKALDERGLRVFDTGNYSASLYKLFKRPDLAGIKVLELDGEEYRLHNYYPRLIDDTELAELQSMNATRKRRKGKGEIPGIITGLSTLYCGYCGSAVVGQNLMGRAKKPDGTLQDGHRRLICCGHSIGGRCSIPGSCSVVPVEKAILSYCSDQFNLSRLMGNDDRAQTLHVELIAARGRIVDLERQLARVTEALLADEGGATPLVFVRKARELEGAIAQTRSEENRIEVEVRRASQRHMPDVAQAWAELVDGTLALDYDSRMRARQLVEDTFERIVIYQRGMTPGDTDVRPIDLLLIAKGGRPRALRINRRTGAWIAGEEGGI